MNKRTLINTWKQHSSRIAISAIGRRGSRDVYYQNLELVGYTSNQCVGGTVTASAGNTPANAFDGDKTVSPIEQWNTGSWNFSSYPNDPEWIRYQFTEPKQIEKVAIWSCGNTAGVEEWSVAVLSGSNNGSDFTTIDTFNKQVVGAVGVEEFTFSNPNSYSYYKLTVTFNVTGPPAADGAHIKEIEMYEGIYG